MSLEQSLKADLPRVFDNLKENRENVREYHTLTDSLEGIVSMLFLKQKGKNIDLQDLEWAYNKLSSEIDELATLKSNQLLKNDFKGYHKLVKALEKLKSIQDRVGFVAEKMEVAIKLNQ